MNMNYNNGYILLIILIYRFTIHFEVLPKDVN